MVLFFAAVLALQSCNWKEQNNQETPQAVDAEVLTLQLTDAVIEQSFPASLQGKTNIDLRPQISGYIDKIYVDEVRMYKQDNLCFASMLAFMLNRKITL